MKIFPSNLSLEHIKTISEVNMLGHLGIEITHLGDNFIEGTMPVNEKTMQPFGLLHGGASVVLAESLGSLAANLIVNDLQKVAVGLEINANHLKPVKKGLVTGKASPIHLGKSTQVWEILLSDEDKNLICISRLTVAIVDKK